MKIFSAAQIKSWDEFTISNKPIAAVDLMEKAATACFRWIRENMPPGKSFVCICGSGNNGGDGLALARLLQQDGQPVKVYLLQAAKKSADCQTNFDRLKATGATITEILGRQDFPLLDSRDIVIDALFGTGLNKPLTSIAKELVEEINRSSATVISIDIPSGLFADATSKDNTIVKAGITLSFQCNKLAFMFAENAPYVGDLHILNIGLLQQFYRDTPSRFSTISKATVETIYKPRKPFTHKYTFGHALLYAGSSNMIGAALLSAKACLRAGAGLVTVHTEEHLMPVIQTALPEAIASAESDVDALTKKKAAIGIGPGLQKTEFNSQLLYHLVSDWNEPLVIDASALPMLKPFITALSKRNNPAILTPHTGEFEQLFGNCDNDFEMAGLAMEKAAVLNCYILLKGKNSLVACPDGEGYFNTTGNSGMATAGSGDVLTGIITGLLAQGYANKDACLLAVYLHGLAGDLAAAEHSQEAMLAGDITEKMGAAYKTLTRAL